MLDLRDKVVLVTGASSGIGWHLGLLLARRGARVVATARRGRRLVELQRRIETGGGATPLVIPCDVSDPDQVRSLRDKVQAHHGALDVLVNNAGRGAYGPIETISTEQVRSMVGTNLLGAIHCTQAFLPAMLERKRGHLVFISSVLGELPAWRHAVYGSTKFAVSGLAENLEYELEPRGIKVILVEPGLVRSEFAAVSGTPPERFDQLPSKTAAEAAALALRALEREKRRYVADGLSSLGVGLRRHFPRTTRLLFRLIFRRMNRK